MTKTIYIGFATKGWKSEIPPSPKISVLDEGKKFFYKKSLVQSFQVTMEVLK